MSRCIPVILAPLERAAAGKSSGSNIQWSDELLKLFEKLRKESLGNVSTIHVPKPSDKLDLYCDYSAEAQAVGGKLVITRNDDEGEVKTLLTGHFSIRLTEHQQKGGLVQGRHWP